jgi:ankyrin repeat protein
MLLQSGAAAVNRVDYAGRTALTLASLGPNVDVKKTLLSHGADVNLRGNDFEHTPLVTAVVWSTCEIVTILIEHGADIKLTTRRLGTISVGQNFILAMELF